MTPAAKHTMVMSEYQAGAMGAFWARANSSDEHAAEVAAQAWYTCTPPAQRYRSMLERYLAGTFYTHVHGL